ncbi:MAG: sucrase ferredoxin [Anaerolineae bacterium]
MRAAPGTDAFYCSDCSREVGEQRFGTSTPARVVLALEYGGSWPRKALVDNTLPEQVRDWLQAGVPGLQTRPLLIRQPGRTAPPYTLLVAFLDETAPRLYRFALNDYDECLQLDLAALAATAPVYDTYLMTDPVALVCVNGRRDRACARDGMPVFHALARQGGVEAWQSTHLGGHRFAATALFLPHGLHYGHLLPADAVHVLEQIRQGGMELAHLRGRMCYPKSAQAAEYYLRTATGQTAPGAYHLESVEAVGDAAWLVTFSETERGIRHVLHVAADDSVEVIVNSTDTTPEAVPQWRLVQHETQAQTGSPQGL